METLGCGQGTNCNYSCSDQAPSPHIVNLHKDWKSNYSSNHAHGRSLLRRRLLVERGTGLERSALGESRHRKLPPQKTIPGKLLSTSFNLFNRVSHPQLLTRRFISVDLDRSIGYGKDTVSCIILQFEITQCCFEQLSERDRRPSSSEAALSFSPWASQYLYYSLDQSQD